MGIHFSNLNRVNLGSAEARKLRVYAFDPTLGRRQGNDLLVEVPWEELTPGPVGPRLRVVDYDSAADKYYQPVDLNEPKILSNSGLAASECDPRFHQQMVYAVARVTLRHFEFALGRDVRWGYHRRDPLTLYPHGTYEANAYYSRELKGVVFGYFRGDAEDAGQTIFTCLSHDIVAHEVTHALIDGERRHFMTPTGFDTPAFHEAFADLVALFQHFSCEGALLDAVQRTAGRLHLLDLEPIEKKQRGAPELFAEAPVQNPMVQLARQFGEAMGKRASLRTALGTPPDPRELEKRLEPHERGAILVAAVFDAFFSLYLDRTRDLMRIARASNASLEPGYLHPDLAARLAGDASRLASQFVNLLIRALDYCPPVDITFGDFLRALITADRDLIPDDDLGYRETLLNCFRRRGIRPDGLRTWSESDVLWEQFESANLGIDLSFDLGTASSGEEGEKNAKALLAFAKRHRDVTGLCDEGVVSAESFHPMHRIGPDGQLAIGVAAELIQRGKDGSIGGTTLLFNGDGTLRYSLARPWNDEARAARCETFERHLAMNDSDGVYRDSSAGDSPGLDFRRIHGGV